MTRMVFDADGLPVYRQPGGSMSVTGFEGGTVLVHTRAGCASTTHHLSTAGARALADALLTAAQAVDLETADARRAEAA